ncbi:MAG TPA: HD-GYP domain-containing protein [Desulfotomaculum sp.]|nr:HD-GYP domain-containing protein [Desulfotomaculum sp.]
MRRLAVSKLTPGMRVGRNVYGKDGQIWLAKGVLLTGRYIERLRELRVPVIYVDDGFVQDAEVKDIISEETRQQAVQQMKALLLEAETPKATVINPPVGIYRTVEKIVQQVLANKGVLYNLMDIRAEDEYLFYHSVNVCLLATMAGATLGWGREQLEELALGALLHDIGKVRVPANILRKPGSLTKREFEEVKKHTVYGYEMLQNLQNARKIARSHHERLNGQGYPDGLQNDIPADVQLTGMADIYDALTADRIYREAYQPFEAYEMLAGTGDFWFDYRLILAFLSNIAAFPAGSVVRLVSGAVAVVLETRPGLSLHPRVRVIVEPTGERPVSSAEFWCHEAGVGVLRTLTHEEIKALGLI